MFNTEEQEYLEEFKMCLVLSLCPIQNHSKNLHPLQ
jgi:hypothetical protein